jgi:hypothetical protein
MDAAKGRPWEVSFCFKGAVLLFPVSSARNFQELLILEEFDLAELTNATKLGAFVPLDAAAL